MVVSFSFCDFDLLVVLITNLGLDVIWYFAVWSACWLLVCWVLSDELCVVVLLVVVLVVAWSFVVE